MVERVYFQPSTINHHLSFPLCPLRLCGKSGYTSHVSIVIGTSGFSYEDWKGYFYPPDLKKGDMLSFYARYFPAVEINSTYYRLPTPATMFQMTRKVPDGFEFVVKAHADMTHSEQYQPEAFAQFREAL